MAAYATLDNHNLLIISIFWRKMCPLNFGISGEPGERDANDPDYPNDPNRQIGAKLRVVSS